MKRPWCEDERRSVNTYSTVCSWKSRPYEGSRRGKGPEGTILEGCLSTTLLLIWKGGLLHECFCFKIMSSCSACLHVETLVGVNFYVKLTIKSIWKWLFFLHFLDRFIVINRSMLNDANRNECSCKDARSHYLTDDSLVQFNNDLELSINK